MDATPLESLPRVPAVATGAEGRKRFALTGIRGHFVTFIETFKLALDALHAHKLRSFLTLLGVILAVLTLVTVMSVVAGLNFYVADRVANLGANVYLIDRFGIITSEDAWVKAQKRPLVTLEEFEWIRDNMKLASRVAAAGWVMIPLALASMITLTLIIYCFFTLTEKSITTPELLERMEPFFENEDLDGLAAMLDVHVFDDFLLTREPADSGRTAR